MNKPNPMDDERVQHRSARPLSDADTQIRGRITVVRAIVCAVLGIVLVGGGGMAVWYYPFISEGSAQSSSATKQNRASANDSNTSTFARHASEGGVKTCKDTYASLGEALVAGATYGVQTDTTSKDADKHSIQGLVGLSYAAGGDYNGAAAGLVFASPAPNARNCEGTMVRVVPFKQSCQAAANLLPKGSRQGKSLAGVYTFAMPNGGNAMLLPSGEHCVVLSVIRGGG